VVVILKPYSRRFELHALKLCGQTLCI